MQKTQEWFHCSILLFWITTERMWLFFIMLVTETNEFQYLYGVIIMTWIRFATKCMWSIVKTWQWNLYSHCIRLKMPLQVFAVGYLSKSRSGFKPWSWSVLSLAHQLRLYTVAHHLVSYGWPFDRGHKPGAAGGMRAPGSQFLETVRPPLISWLIQNLGCKITQFSPS